MLIHWMLINSWITKELKNVKQMISIILPENHICVLFVNQSYNVINVSKQMMGWLCINFHTWFINCFALPFSSPSSVRINL